MIIYLVILTMAVLLYFIYSYVVLVQYFQKKKKKLRTFNNEFPLTCKPH